ncbi:Protein phosphatase methylesterase 1 [Parelaphostrongylus tenuis]|uniref:Protein phosphatase methylesterase 1 n=1 Tax=Parelaphostrongylus tenuis TaxID=148309 RepID=A0AAD5MFX9_PARTN|nr:Protein phosphatase methylesterase 1 [Parelaphostrongylus tenuis]
MANRLDSNGAILGGWFQGLSSKFLSCSPPKLLVLAGVDRLDKELMIAQMQGKFQNTILPKVGHAVHEDSPDRLADEIARFAIRNRFAEAVPGGNFIAARPMMGMGVMI